MASITRINSVYHVRVRIKGHKIECKSFAYKADALRWAKETERVIQLGILITNDCTLNGLIDRYATQISPTKRSAYDEPFRLQTFRNGNSGGRAAFWRAQQGAMEEAGAWVVIVPQWLIARYYAKC